MNSREVFSVCKVTQNQHLWICISCAYGYAENESGEIHPPYLTDELSNILTDESNNKFTI